MLETLEARLAETLLDTKLKILAYIRKYENNGESRFASKLNLYTNPYILINKINSERNDAFVQDLKRVLRGESVETLDTFNPKYEFITLQTKIKGIVAGSSNEVFSLPK